MTVAVAALELHDISHAYDNNLAVAGASLHVDEGEVVCLLGPSGCGKSTILRIAAGLEPLQQGEVRMGGVTVAGGGLIPVPPERRGVGLVFQDFALFPHLNVAGNIAFGLSDLAPRERPHRVAEVLAQVDMSDFAEAYPHALSGGQQQRIALARALAPRPRILLLDEPFSGLDARLREQIREDTLRVLKQSGAATLMVTHDPDEAMFMADRIYLMKGGRVVQSGSPDALYRRPVDPFVARFFTAVNEFAGVVTAGRVATPLGVLPAPGFRDGMRVLVLVRPEAIHLVPAGTGSEPVVAGTLTQARFLGGVHWLEVSLRGADGAGVTVKVHHAGRDVPEAGGRVLLTLDPRDALIFATTSAGDAEAARGSDEISVLSNS
ncbi:iron(III) transport system ATP-binding protein [Dongia mobilis]|uniref:Iron(III) transport system ATP-binding protein n=1 Tax=Dongia mobilis TaxID=578943 RepID=A0A4V3DDQ2_9PROT|nr:ABC transporter ATP-binding protein [Dongia mobilis]TDQ77592.1 iron(III) transport system ATP-binding protein [Dongia mobilis]